jgi:hypothetical protein
MGRAYGPHEFSVTETQAFGMGWYSAARSVLVFAHGLFEQANKALTINNFIMGDTT